MKLKAYAKINLGLRILKKRSDGYHDIESIFHYINWNDILEIEPSSEFKFTCSDSLLPTDETNLVVKAVREIEKITGQLFNYRVHLIKNIPFGAGLGGGSSDAAAIIRFAQSVYFFSDETAGKVAALLGSDLNFFLTPKTQIATDRGIVLKSIDFKLGFYIVTVFPKVSVATKWAYQQIKLKNEYSKTFEEIINEKPKLIDYRKLFVNDFDEPVSSQVAEIKTVKEKLDKSGSFYTSLSGSGSAVFGLFENKLQAEKTVLDLEKHYLVNLTQPEFTI